LVVLGGASEQWRFCFRVEAVRMRPSYMRANEEPLLREREAQPCGSRRNNSLPPHDTFLIRIYLAILHSLARPGLTSRMLASSKV
jgi:hypothetical protein